MTGMNKGMKKIHLGSHNDYVFHSKVKKHAKKHCTRISRRKLSRSLAREISNIDGSQSA